MPNFDPTAMVDGPMPDGTHAPTARFSFAVATCAIVPPQSELIASRLHHGPRIMPKRRSKSEELVPGVPMREVLEFLCRQSGALSHKEDSEWEPDDDRFQFFYGFGVRRPDAVQALIAKGWIVEAPSKQRTAKMRYRLTEAGRRLGADSAHLFKWPAVKSKIAPAFAYSAQLERSTWRRYLNHLSVELARRDGDEFRLATHQREMLRDLEAGLDEEAIAEMLEWWNYRIEALVDRGKASGHGYRPARPRIEVHATINQKDNFTVRWNPVGLRLGEPTDNCDWVRWRENEHRRIAYDSRPSNELLFVHSVQDAARRFPGFYNQEYDTPDGVMVDAILLQALAALVAELKQRLDYHFEVSMYSDIFIELEQVSNPNWPRNHDDVLATWRIENVARRKKRIELALIQSFPESYGCSIDQFRKAFVDADAKKRTGPPPSLHTRDQRVAKLLKDAGHVKISLGVVTRYRELLERHQPGLIPEPAASTSQNASSTSSVVPFTRNNGSGKSDPSQGSH